VQASTTNAERPGAIRRLLRAVAGRREQSIPANNPATSEPRSPSALTRPVTAGGTRLARAVTASTAAETDPTPVQLDDLRPRATRVAAPAPAPAPAPRPQTTAAEPAHDVIAPARLAAVRGATIARSETGTETVTFASPPDESLVAAAEPSAPAGGQAESATGSVAAASPSLPAPSTPPPRIDVDDVYEQMLERLRHDLVTEHERIGQPLDHLPPC
jgi:hypothetical protein